MITSKQVKPLLIGGVIGALLSYAAFISLQSTSNIPTAKVEDADEDKPLYWVAPMDANYQRDKPGQSPMGMDLVPVYAENSSGESSGLGAIKISPEVINNLGVRTAQVELKRQNNIIRTVGYVTYDENKLVQVSPRIKGWVEKLYVKTEGEYITKGQPLYDLYSPELVNAQEELLLALQRNNKHLINAAENRLVALQVPKSEISRLKKTGNIKQNLTFFAPQSGVIESLAIREGSFVQPSNGILVIADLTQVWVNVEVLERQSSMVSFGDRVTMSLDYLPGKHWQGSVDYIYPVLNEQTRTLIVRLKFSNVDAQLKPNMFAQINIESANDDKLLIIPSEALIRAGEQDRVVLALGEGRFKSIAVNVGKVFDHNVEILSGLIEGELVVTSAQFLLDSESSKSSDFKRMHHMQEDTQSSMQDAPTAKTTGVINTIMVDHRMINISRAAIKKWGRDAATLDFMVADHVDFSMLEPAMPIDFTFEIIDGEFMITEISVSTDPSMLEHANH